jgi:hypothetical protein
VGRILNSLSLLSCLAPYRLAQIGVPAINLRDEEIDAEIQAAREIAT